MWTRKVTTIQCPFEVCFPHQLVAPLLDVAFSDRGVWVCMWVDVKITVPFWVLAGIRHLVVRGPKRGP